jgi:hypothetical protein
MTTIVKAADAAHFLSLVPRMFGFTPSRSVVVIPFAGGRSAGGMRVDLPPDADVEVLASTLVGMACRVEGADAYALVVYDDAAGTGVEPPGALLAAALRRSADVCGLRTIDALYVGRREWGSYLDAGIGGSVAELAPDPPSETGATPRGDQRTGAELASVDPSHSEQTALALRELSRAMRILAGAPACEAPLDDAAGGGKRVDPAALSATLLLEDLPLFFERSIARGPQGSHVPGVSSGVPDRDVYAQAALIWCLARPSLRDIGLSTWLAGLDGGDEAVEAQLRWEDGAEYPPDLAERMWGEGVRPDPDRLTAALHTCRNAAAVAPSEDRPGPLAACAWLSWALGRLTHAEIYARQACEIEPEHGLASIVLSFVAAGHLPDWAFRR